MTSPLCTFNSFSRVSLRNCCSRSSPSTEHSSTWDISPKLPLRSSLMKTSLMQKKPGEILTTPAFWRRKSLLRIFRTRMSWVRTRNSTCSSRMFHQPWQPVFYITSCRVSSVILLRWCSRRRTTAIRISDTVTFNSKRRRISTKSCSANRTKERLPWLTAQTPSTSRNSAVRDQRLKLTRFISLVSSSRRSPLRKRKLSITKSWELWKVSREILGISKSSLSTLSTMNKRRVSGP